MSTEDIVKNYVLRDRGRLRPLPLRHVRHRVPQGAARRRLRRLPRHALPADGRPLAGHRRRHRPRDEPAVLHRRIIKARAGRRRLNAIGYRLRPYEVEAGRHRPRHGDRQEGLLRGASPRRSRSSSRSGRRKEAFADVKVDRAHAQAQGQHHRRVLGHDDRGRRQLPAAALPREEGGESDIQLVDGVAPLQHLGEPQRHQEPRDAARRRRRASTASPSSATCGVAKREATLWAADIGAARRLPDVRARRRPLRLPPARHGQDRRRRPRPTTTTTSAAAKATWRSASSS